MAVEVVGVAHGGHCVARHQGQVLFVRHALPGELVVAEVTAQGRKGRSVHADAVEVLRVSPHRRVPVCPVADRCGGCDWQHTTPAASRELKAEVVHEALARFAGVELPAGFAVQAVVDPTTGEPLDWLGWRTRGVLSVDAEGRAGLRAQRSHEVVVGPGCPQLHPRLVPLQLFERRWAPGTRVGFVAPSGSAPLALEGDHAPAGPVVEVVDGAPWRVAADGFWQVHPGAAQALVGHVAAMLGPRPGERLVDLYAGVGLFGLSLARSTPAAAPAAAAPAAPTPAAPTPAPDHSPASRRVMDSDQAVREIHEAGSGTGLRVTLVEGDRRASELAAVNAEGLGVEVVRAAVDRWVTRPRALAGVDLVVLDPPRVGAGAAVVAALAAAGPRAIAYVACDPVALARDVATFQAQGYRLDRLVALDLFPATHHVECVALLVPAGA